MKALFSSFLSLCAVSALAADVTHLATVSNVSFSQNANQDVIVTYDLANDGEPAFVTLDVLTNGVPLPVAAVQPLSGDVSTSLADFIDDGTGKQIVWKARTDWKGNLTSNATVVVSAHYTNHLEGVYLRVDVTGGTAASAWPYHFGSVEPDVTSHAFLQDEIWLKCVPAGTFLMGSPANEIGRGKPDNYNTDETQHMVALTKPFFIGVTPVTRKQWQNMTGSTNSLAIVGNESCPAGNVRYTFGSANATRADSLVSKLDAKTGLSGFNLPTEAQWEYACRADTQGVWSDGSPWDPGTTESTFSTSTNLASVAWYSANSSIGGKKVVHPVATREPNDWGLYDFLGNVWEWCRDWSGDYSTDNITTNPTGPDTGSKRIVRGGSKDTSAFACRAATRNHYTPTETSETRGLRLAFEF